MTTEIDEEPSWQFDQPALDMAREIMAAPGSRLEQILSATFRQQIPELAAEIRTLLADSVPEWQKKARIQVLINFALVATHRGDPSILPANVYEETHPKLCFEVWTIEV